MTTQVSLFIIITVPLVLNLFLLGILTPVCVCVLLFLFLLAGAGKDLRTLQLDGSFIDTDVVYPSKVPLVAGKDI